MDMPEPKPDTISGGLLNLSRTPFLEVSQKAHLSHMLWFPSPNIPLQLTHGKRPLLVLRQAWTCLPGPLHTSET